MLYIGLNSYLFVKCVEIYKFKAKYPEKNEDILCLGNISKDISTDDMKKTGLYEYVYDFSVDYESFDFDNFLNIHKYLMNKHNKN